jgi:carbamoyltransferase
MRFLGVKFLGHDSAVAIIDSTNREIFAISTERVTRIKHDWIDVSCAIEALELWDFDFCCHSFSNFNEVSDTAGWTVYENEKNLAFRKIVNPKYIKDLAISRRAKNWLLVKGLFLNPVIIFQYLLNNFLAKNARHNHLHDAEWHKCSLLEYSARKLKLKTSQIRFYDHHLCHATAAYHFSPYVGKQALSLTLDGQGDGSFSKAFIFNSNEVELIGDSPTRPLNIAGQNAVTSIGELYGNFTEALGLRRLSDEGKVEAMAAYAVSDPVIYGYLKDSIIFENNSITFSIEKIAKFYNINYLKSLAKQVGDKVFSATIQTFLQDVSVDYLNLIGQKHPNINTLCLSGGVAANIIMSLNIYERTQFKNIYVLPPMGDEGTALGAAILCAKEQNEDISWLAERHMPYFGDQISNESLMAAISKFSKNIRAERLDDSWHVDAAKSIAEGKVIALVNGRMEFGPRALGNRSIVANPAIQEIRDRINSTVKRRPSYQPFCPSILESERDRLFHSSFPHKHMAIAFRMKEEFHTKLPSAIHVDGTARPQFVEASDNSEYYKFLLAVKGATGFGVVLNTSFNLHGRTVVRTADDAITDFLDCNLDHLYIDGYKISRI